MGSLLLSIGLVFAQEVGPPPESTEPEPVEEESVDPEEPTEAAPVEESVEAPVEESVEESVEAPVEESVAASAAQSVDVRVELVNGMVLSGSASLMEVISWSVGDPIHFTVEGGSQVLLPGKRILSVGPVVDAPPVSGQQPFSGFTRPAPSVVDPKWANYTSPEGFSPWLLRP